MSQQARPISDIVEDLKQLQPTYSKLAKATEKIFSNLERRDRKEIYAKPETPEKFKEVKQYVDKRMNEIKVRKKTLNEGKNNSAIFRTLSRGSREDILKAKLVSPRMNELGIFPQFYSAKNSKMFMSQGIREDLEIQKMRKQEEEKELRQFNYFTNKMLADKEDAKKGKKVHKKAETEDVAKKTEGVWPTL
jgi:hypothetical protein